MAGPRTDRVGRCEEVASAGRHEIGTVGVIPLDEAQTYVLERCTRRSAVAAPLSGARGLVLADPVVSPEAVPPFANTAMDGYALRAGDVEDAPVELRVVGTLAAGMAPSVTVGPGEAVRIMTGAPMPPGADAVVMVELTELSADEASVRVAQSVPLGNHIRAAGEDLVTGQEVFAAGAVLSPGHLGVLASIGAYEVAVFPRLRVGVMSTGDELVDGPSALAPGQIRESNRYALLALLDELGVVAVDLGLIADDEQAITEALLNGAETCDALITSGGVSMGDFDFVKVVLDRIGDMRWMQVAIKPAKPLAFGLIGSTPVFGLPGNPVSSMVSFELFARPGLRKMMGHADLDRPRVHARMIGDLRRRDDGKVHFNRVRVDIENGEYVARSAGGQGSHQLTAMATANGLAVNPGAPGLVDGEQLEVLLLS